MSRWLSKSRDLRDRGGNADRIVREVRADVERSRASLGPRLATVAAANLGFLVWFVRWDHDERTGADLPIFRVAAQYQAQAEAAGLSVEVE